jgi:hypothetical protein
VPSLLLHARHSRSILWAAILLLSGPGLTHAAEPSPAPAPNEATAPAPLNAGLLPAAAAILPGVLIHGTGHLAGGDREGGVTLLRWQGIGTAIFLSGVLPLGFSGASRHLVTPAAYLTAIGAGIFALSWFADVYGASTGGRAHAAAYRTQPRWTTKAGLAWVYDPQFDYHAFSHIGASYHVGRLILAPEAWFSVDTPHSRFSVEAGWRLRGSRPEKLAADDTRLDAILNWRRRAYEPQGFVAHTGTISLRGRYDMARMLPSLAGSFAEGEFGWGLDTYDYDLPVAWIERDFSALLLARFGYGIRFGRPTIRHGELVAFYSHRQDELTGGSGTGSVGDGVTGYWGTEGRWFFFPQWGLEAGVAQGAAWVSRVSLLYRGGGL